MNDDFEIIDFPETNNNEYKGGNELTLPDKVLDSNNKSMKELDITYIKEFHTVYNYQIPSWLTKPFVISGYRLYFTKKLCFYSIFRLHNETFNIWSHLLGIILILIFIYRLYFTLFPLTLSLLDIVIVALYYVGVLLCLFSSCSFHTFNSHNYSTYCSLYCFDVSSIIILVCFSYIPALYYGFRCNSICQISYISSIITITIVILFLINYKVKKTLQITSIVFSICISVFPICHWMIYSPSEEIELFLWRILFLLGSYGFGFLFYIFAIPERLYPGYFDIWCNSHTLWHIFVVIASVSWIFFIENLIIYTHTHTC